MANSAAFRKAASALLHPLSLTAILLLLLNDHILRRFWPSWVTGKLGDFAWLFFFPFVMTMLLACILPVRKGRLKDLPALAAFGLVGSVFTLAKTVPDFHSLLVQSLKALLSAPVGLRLDPSDLITLPTLLASWWLWRRIPELPAYRLRPVWVIASLAALFTLANSVPVRETGITWLKYENGNVYAGNNIQYGNTWVACSPDGGVTWECPEGSYEGISIPDETFCYVETRMESEQTTWTTIEVLSQPGTILRYKPNDDIEISTDGGQTWQVEYTPKPVNDWRYAYHLKDYRGNVCVIDTPITAVVDPTTGNVIFAMGLEGVLVRRADGTYRPVAVYHFEPVDLGQPNIMWMLLKGELWLAALLGGLGVATLGLHWRRDWFMWCANVVLWIGWGCIAFLFRPAMVAGLEEDITSFSSYLMTLLILPFTFNAFIMCGVFSKQSLLQLIFAWLGSMVLYGLPFLLWAQELMPLYYLAAGFGILLSGGFLVWRWFALKARIGDAFYKLTSAVHSGMRLQKVSVLIMLAGIVFAPVSLQQASTQYISFGLFGIGYLVLLAGLIRFWRAVIIAQREEKMK
jgi:hypothetical protein